MTEPTHEVCDVAIIVGSGSDLEIVEASGMLDTLQKIGVSYRVSIISAHRHPEALRAYVKENISRMQVFIGVAGMANHLAGAIAAHTSGERVVIGVPLQADDFPTGLDALLSTVRMPSGRPVLVPGIGKSGLVNAAIAACQILALKDDWVAKCLRRYHVASGNTKPDRYNVRSAPRKESV